MVLTVALKCQPHIIKTLGYIIRHGGFGGSRKPTWRRSGGRDLF